MHEYIKPLADLFEASGNAEYAFRMKKYMKGQFEYFGINSPKRREIQKLFLAQNGLPEKAQLDDIIKNMWQLPEREFQYTCMEILGKLSNKAEKERIDLYEYLVLNKSWWDSVDFISSNLVGVHFQKYPELMIPYTEKWMNSANIWLQRTSLLFQLRYRNNTNLDLLTDYIQRLQGSREFFINKAIGWILREYSKTDPNWVIQFVKKHQLANLSKREALKWLQRKQKIK
jgi:3-methyladenine DNA glycosylase AlkD